jgi:diaminohydroxyphosphoribosylaminopyrimidine deaminase/5-amino-6-(5-phosphoribosylamino)uracil reductase
MTSTNSHEAIMRLVLEKAKGQLGKTAPNPATAACLVKDGHIISWGVHEKAGQPHAEVLAIANAKDQAKGATLYVNLEPCTHHGLTPPCTDAIITAGITQVVYASVDPNPKVRETPANALLQDAGITVVSGILDQEAKALNKVFWINHTQKRPFIRLKAGMTLDGKVALSNGESQYITGLKSRHIVHQLRDLTGSILIGYKTINKDNPQLNIRLNETKSLTNLIIIDPFANTHPDSQVFEVNKTAKIILVTLMHTLLPEKLKSKVTQLKLPDRNGVIDMKDVCEAVYKEGVTDILVEGGTGTYSQLVSQSLVDEYHLFYAPILMGGKTDHSLLTINHLHQKIDHLERLSLHSVDRLEDDIYLVLTPRK